MQYETWKYVFRARKILSYKIMASLIRFYIIQSINGASIIGQMPLCDKGLFST